MPALLSWLAQLVFLLVVTCFALYLALELRVLLISNRVERRKLTEFALPSAESGDTFRPLVSVLLPVCNESAVVERLIDAACRLRYPANALEILVLDDSSDDTSVLAQARVERHAALGVNIQFIRRENRKAYKAGNLLHGIQRSSGEFFAIFDADFVPPEDFLLKTIPCFRDPRLGFLQTGIGYENRDASFLTRFQAMEMGHQQYVTVGLSEDGDMASLSGSSCVWRKACVEALGGWNAATVTEDVDLGYRAQFGNWKYAFLRDVVSMSVLPETISAFRVQRERWGRGLIHSGFKHVREMFRQRMPLMKRLHAISMMFSSVLLASIHALVLLSLPLNHLIDSGAAGIPWVALTFFGLVAVWALDNAFGARKGARFDEMPGIARTLWDAYLYVALFVPMAWYYFAGGIRALFGVYGDFHRTPKGGNERRSAMPGINTVLLAGELLTFAYSLLAMLLAFRKGNYYLIPMNFTVCVGFGMVLYWTWQERRGNMQTVDAGRRRILITGATGAIGAALAERYAQPGAALYLHGRNEARLAEVAERCATKGAQVETRRMDARDFPALQGWLESLGPLDLVIINAGMNTHVGPSGEPEPWDVVEALLDVNLKAAMLSVQAVLPAMRARGAGQIALVSSLAGYFGLPVTPAYCASKAGIKAYGEALRGWLAPEGIRVNVIMPGYVKSPLCDGMPGPKPFLWPPERAARAIRRGLARDEARISFPFPLNWGTWWLAALPAAVSTRIVRWLGYGV
ncbi:MAG: SDR family NAD(P)-dependent oxidoreductase [Zoogloeaceae bacterium]|jgi:cellulose synthase (UDP-forming)|nr:SDR family NAD(P)-dependent oxidoreductase [Zoogloeaceae bacterium]